MSTTSPDVLVELDRSKTRGLRAQIEDELRAAIRTGRLAPGTALPSSRALAADLGVTRGVVVNAYDQLVAEGYLVSRTGSGTVVASTRHDPQADPGGRTSPATVEVDFRPGLPDLALFPRTAWSRASRSALQTLPDADLGYSDPRGIAVLRRALADYLARVRGVSTDPERVIVCDGYGHGLSMVAGALRAAGHESAAVEDPGYDGSRDGLAAMGLRSVGVDVDADGLVVERLRATAERVAVVTPAHQSPTGVVLTPERRQQLVAWARSVDGVVIEDDYDAEYRYDRRPVGVLQGIGPDRVVYCGTASKSLAPGVRLGWLVVPQELVEPIAAQRKVVDGATSALLQATFASFLTNGDLDRHLRRTRRIYRRRRDALIEALARHLPDAVPGGVAAGLQVLVTLPHGLDEVEVAARALEEGVKVYPLASYRARSTPMAPAVFLGYGAIGPERAERGVALLGGPSLDATGTGTASKMFGS